MTTTYIVAPSMTSIAEGDILTFTIHRLGDRLSEIVYFSTLSDTASFGEGDYELA